MRRLAHWIEDKWELLRVGAPLRIGPTATLALGVYQLGVYHRWEPGRVFVIVTAYGDESGTHEESPVMMLAGFVSTLGRWNQFDDAWRRALKHAGLPGYFHATEHWNTEAGQKFAPIALKLQKKHLLFGYVIELDRESYDRYYIAGRRIKKPQLDTRYSLCFRFLLAFLLTRLPQMLCRGDMKLNFLLEEGAAGSADSHRIIHLLRKQPETQEISQMLASAPLSFGGKKRFPGLQVSDALSFGALKISPNDPQMIDLPQDAPLAHARQVVQFKPPIFHCRLDETLLSPHKTDIEMLVEIRRRLAEEAIAARNARNS
jgi:hypothetical protein